MKYFSSALDHIQIADQNRFFLSSLSLSLSNPFLIFHRYDSNKLDT
jgi:hypothetical protein